MNIKIKNIIKKILKPFFYYLPQLPNSIRYGKVYRDTYKFLQESQYWSKEQIEEWQLKKLQELIKHAYKTVPYYQKLFDNINLKPDDIKTLEDIRKIPYLTKEIIRENLNELVSSKLKNKLRYVSTGGSTGNPMEFYTEWPITNIKEHAFVWWLFGLKNIKESDRFLIMRGAQFKGEKFYRYEKKNKLQISSYHLNSSNFESMLSIICDYSPHVIQAFPSSLKLLAKWMKENGLQYHNKNLKVILTSSENLGEDTQKLFYDIFNVETFDLYGQSEKVSLINRCEYNNYHIIPQYGITELLDYNGNEVTIGKKGEIIATGFNNFAFPFIRYKTEDFAIKKPGICKCNRNFPLIDRIEGRIQDYLVGKDGSLVSIASTNTHIDIYKNVEKFQFYQNQKGYFELRIVEKKGIKSSSYSSLKKELNKILNNNFDFSIKIIDEIPRTKTGKYKFLIQKLSLKFEEE